MKVIKINSKVHGELEILVDDEDYEYINQWKWHAYKNPSSNIIYARRNVNKNRKNPKNQSFYLHRQLLKLTSLKDIVDHVDHNGLNNQKYNLRIGTHKDNMQNINSHKDSSSKYIGVFWDKSRNKWAAGFSLNGVPKRIGRFNSEEDAAKARDEIVKKYYGKNVNLNFK